MNRDEQMRIAVCWSNLSGYAAACWQALQDLLGRDRVLFICSPARATATTEFKDNYSQGIELYWRDRGDYESLVRRLIEFSPTGMLISGWNDSQYIKLCFDRRFAGCKKMMAIDNQRRPRWRQFLGKYVRHRLLQRVDGIVVPGERSWQLARFLGFEDSRILRGTYAVDTKQFSTCLTLRQIAWPKSFLFVGRFVEDKGVGLLIDAYKIYRSAVPEPWPMTVCGKGPMEWVFQGSEGITNVGFVQPAELTAHYAQAGAFILPSQNEPWGQVIVEAAASGLPIVCTEACGASVELVHDYFNGFTVPTTDKAELSYRMIWLHRNWEKLPELGQMSSVISRAFDSELWAERVVDKFNRLPRREARA